VLALRGGQGNQPPATATLVSQGFATLSSTTQGALGLTVEATAEPQSITEEAIETDSATQETADASVTDVALTTSETAPTEDVTRVDETPDGDTTAEATIDSGNAPVASTPAEESEMTAVETALADFETIPDSTGKQETLLGSTLLTDVCSTPDIASLQDTLYRSMNALASASNAVSADTQALGVRVVDCSSNEVLRVIAAPLESALAFSSGNIEEETFQARWVAVA
jgi:hypothetical protein